MEFRVLIFLVFVYFHYYNPRIPIASSILHHVFVTFLEFVITLIKKSFGNTNLVVNIDGLFDRNEGWRFGVFLYIFLESVYIYKKKNSNSRAIVLQKSKE